MKLKPALSALYAIQPANRSDLLFSSQGPHMVVEYMYYYQLQLKLNG